MAREVREGEGGAGDVRSFHEIRRMPNPFGGLSLPGPFRGMVANSLGIRVDRNNFQD